MIGGLKCQVSPKDFQEKQTEVGHNVAERRRRGVKAGFSAVKVLPVDLKISSLRTREIE